MKKFILLAFVLLFANCVTVDSLRKPEQPITTRTEEAEASFYPFSGGLLGGTTGKLDKITGVVAKDTAIGMFEADGTYGDAFMPYVADDSGDGESEPTIIDPDEAGDLRWKLLDLYGMDLHILGDDIFAATNTANYFWVADGTNYNPTSPANALIALGVNATESEIDTPLDGASVTLTEFQELETIDATTISAAQWTGLGGATTAGIALWDDANNVAQLVTLGLSATASEINTPLDGASVTLTEFQELEAIDATTISANQWALLGGVAETLGFAELNLLDGETDLASQAELNAVAALVDTDDEIIAIINASPGTQITHEAGGLEADVNAYSGLIAISGGSTAEVDAKSELEAQIADVADFAEADGDTHTGTHTFEGPTTVGDGGDTVSMQADGTPDADDTYSCGMVVWFMVGDAVAQFDLVMMQTDGYVDQANATGVPIGYAVETNDTWPATAETDLVGVCLLGSGGVIRNDGWTGHTAGEIVYVVDAGGTDGLFDPADEIDLEDGDYWTAVGVMQEEDIVVFPAPTFFTDDGS